MAHLTSFRRIAPTRDGPVPYAAVYSRLLASLLLAATAATARAQTLPSETDPPASPCLDEDAARRGVQAKTFLKRRKLELTPAGGLYASDLLSSSYAPQAGHPSHEPMMKELRAIFDRHAGADGRVMFEYDTIVYSGSLHRSPG